MYSLFDGVVACDFPLSGVPEVEHAAADVTITIGRSPMDETGYDWLHAWRETDGELVLSCARMGDAGPAAHYLLRFPELADFKVVDTLVTCYPRPGCAPDSLHHLLLSQVIPRLWAHRGNLVVHASAVELTDGRVLAIAGDSRWGKSTLAAALQARGARLLCDDSLCLRPTSAGVQLVPSYTGLRLHADSIATLELGGKDWTNVSQYSDKQRLAAAVHQAPAPLYLDMLYLMVEPAREQELAIEPMSGALGLATLIKRSFMLDTRDHHVAALQLAEAGAVLRAVPRACNLTYPRQYRELSAVCEALRVKPSGF